MGFVQFQIHFHTWHCSCGAVQRLRRSAAAAATALGSVGVDGLPRLAVSAWMACLRSGGMNPWSVSIIMATLNSLRGGEGRQGGPSNRHDIFRTMRRWKLGALARKLKIIFWAKDKTTVACMRVLRGYPNYMFTNLYMMMMMMCSTEKFAKALEKCPSHRCWYLLNLVVF